LLPFLVDLGFLGGEEPGPDIHAGRPDRERRRQPAAIPDPTRGGHRNGMDGLGDLGDEHHGSRCAPEPACLASLGDDDVGAVLGCPLCLLHGVDLLDE
jgi:hypothetical protein